MEKLTEGAVVDAITDFLISKKDGNWHIEKSRIANLHEHDVDIRMVGGKRNSEYFLIECKGKSYAKSAKSINKEGWLNALGQLITRMNVNRLDKSGRINRAYRYGLGLPKEGAEVALRRIPFEVARILNIYIFSVNDNKSVTMFTPKDFKKR